MLIIVEGERCRTIPLTKNKEAIVSESDYEYISQWTWGASKGTQTWYATRTQGNPYLFEKMHQRIMQAPPELQVDHRNHNGLDNRRSNLRIATPRQNSRNARTKPHSSKYKGVSFNRKRKLWVVQINRGNGNTTIGRLADEKEAARMYDAAARECFGEFAWLNFPD